MCRFMNAPRIRRESQGIAPAILYTLALETAPTGEPAPPGLYIYI